MSSRIMREHEVLEYGQVYSVNSQLYVNCTKCGYRLNPEQVVVPCGCEPEQHPEMIMCETCAKEANDANNRLAKPSRGQRLKDWIRRQF